MEIAVLSLGSNIGDRLSYLKEAVLELHQHKKINVRDISSIYETDPVGYTDQDLFLNIAVVVETDLQPMELLQECQRIEQELGRKRIKRWGPRTIDLDILLYDQVNMITEQLIIPHPRIMERAFVLTPLLEIATSIPTVDNLETFEEALENLQDREGVRVWKRRDGEGVFALFEN